MDGYVTLDTQDLGRAVKFYDRLARELGARRSMEDVDCVAWGLPGGPASISVVAERPTEIAFILGTSSWAAEPAPGSGLSSRDDPEGSLPGYRYFCVLGIGTAEFSRRFGVFFGAPSLHQSRR